LACLEWLGMEAVDFVLTWPTPKSCQKIVRAKIRFLFKRNKFKKGRKKKKKKKIQKTRASLDQVATLSHLVKRRIVGPRPGTTLSHLVKVKLETAIDSK
jgi:hypothetical protein